MFEHNASICPCMNMMIKEAPEIGAYLELMLLPHLIQSIAGEFNTVSHKKPY